MTVPIDLSAAALAEMVSQEAYHDGRMEAIQACLDAIIKESETLKLDYLWLVTAISRMGQLAKLARELT